MPTFDSAPLDNGQTRPDAPVSRQAAGASAASERRAPAHDDVALARHGLGEATRAALHDIGFDLEDTVSSGGFGVVYRARDRRLDRPVAIKVIDRAVRRPGGPWRALPREIQTLATFQHPHIVPLFEAGMLTDGLPYLVMPWLEGTSLRQRLRTHGPPPIDEVLRIGIDLADALDALHAQGLVHRDIKPENVITNGAHATVIDFGLVCAARPAERDPVSGEFAMGTPTYMSPEQWEHGGAIDGRADVFSLGALLYELLTGHAPNEARLGDALRVPERDRHRWTDTLRTTDTRERPAASPFRRTPRVRDDRPDVPRALDRLLYRAMTRNPNRRLPSAAAFRDGLQQLQASRLNAVEGRRTRRFVLIASLATATAIVAAVPAMVASRLDALERQRLEALAPERVLLTSVQNASGDAALDPVAAQVTQQVQAALARRTGTLDSLVVREVNVVAPPAVALVTATIPDAVQAVRPLALARGTGTVVAVAMDRTATGVALRGVILDARAGTATGTVTATEVALPASAAELQRAADSVVASITDALRTAARTPPSTRPIGID